MRSTTSARQPNRLIHEKSPYLLQHAYNPVDWYPWGEQAFAKAKREDKPVFLSVGYSTCYWCHVMEQESFENHEIAQLLNASFVAIKVDREERPDIDALYMRAVQSMSGQGGWPMTLFLTPEGQPFWGGTYLPPEERWGRPGLPTVLRSMQEAWRTQREQILRSGRELTQALQTRAGPQAEALTQATLAQAVQQIGQQFDERHGGFGPAPKFPRSHTLSLLLRSWDRTRDTRTLAMVEQTLEAMAHGGIHDQLGGGFHRYATDAEWLVPHFEKMLYDQALLARAYLEAYQVTGKTDYAGVTRGIFTYVLRDLRDPGGAFYAAEDAGEVGKEGEFYVWTAEEIAALLTPEEAALCRAVYGVTPGGNFEGRTILRIAQPLEAAATTLRLDPDAAGVLLASAKAKLFAARAHRPRPHRDDKVLTDWNGLMIGALAYGGAALDEPRYTEAAADAARFVLSRLQQDGQVRHRYRDGEAAIPGYLDDYAFLAWGLLELYAATFDDTWLQEAQRLTREMVRRFWDEPGGGFYFSGAHNERLIAQTKEVYDGAVPSGNSVAALVLIRLGQLTMDGDLQHRAEQLLRAFAGQVHQAPHAFPQLLVAVDAWLGPSQEIVIAGDPAAADTRAMMRAVQRRWLPRAVVVVHPSDARRASAIETLAPFVRGQRAIDGHATAYVCQNYACQLPATTVAALTAALDAAR
ncbi:MAG: thioredoxin domain-containing protein [Candidatus Omnitrophica bacterium]|nr:thioredoxin domain-containing protein [Candidatus Omnitrophota bacterium]